MQQKIDTLLISNFRHQKENPKGTFHFSKTKGKQEGTKQASISSESLIFIGRVSEAVFYIHLILTISFGADRTTYNCVSELFSSRPQLALLHFPRVLQGFFKQLTALAFL